uniref:Essential MCU regulator, mitochondrial n=1 Tax=Podarcis muralis TaxID=64176 RepID=A0A670K8S6_PODMU
MDQPLFVRCLECSLSEPFPCPLRSASRRNVLREMPFGLLRVFAIVIPFLYVGTQISKNFAALLEEHDIFVPEDDDDDD